HRQMVRTDVRIGRATGPQDDAVGRRIAGGDALRVEVATFAAGARASERAAASKGESGSQSCSLRQQRSACCSPVRHLTSNGSSRLHTPAHTRIPAVRRKPGAADLARSTLCCQMRHTRRLSWLITYGLGSMLILAGLAYAGYRIFAFAIGAGPL